MPSVTFKRGRNPKTDQKLGVSGNQSLMEAAIALDIPEIEGACGGSLACATCHVYFDAETFARLEKKFPISEEEQDMLELAYGRRPTSRLCCQILLQSDDPPLDVYLA